MRLFFKITLKSKLYNVFVAFIEFALGGDRYIIKYQIDINKKPIIISWKSVAL